MNGSYDSIHIMDVLATNINPHSADFTSQAQFQKSLSDQLRERLRLVAKSGSESAIATQRKRGKLLARERIERLIDPQTPFLELSPLAAWGMYDNEVPSAGVVTGVGSIAGRE